MLPVNLYASEDCTVSDDDCTVTCDGVADNVDFAQAFSDLAEGGTLHIAAGTCAIAAKVDITAQGFILVGAGEASTTIVDSVNNDAMFLVRVGTGVIDISGFTVDGNSATSDGISDGVLRFLGESSDNSGIRVHNIIIDDFVKRAIIVDSNQNKVYALIDNCTFTTSNNPQGITLIGDGPGSSTWWLDNVSSSLGTADFNFVEDCSFNWTGASADAAIDMYGGAKVVVRHNTFRNIRFSIHGTDSGNYVSPLVYEVYENEFLNHLGTENEGKAFHARGATGVVYNNTWESGYTALLELNSYRSYGDYPDWGQCDGSSLWDGNSDTDGESGTATSGGSTSMTKSAAGWTTNEWAGYHIHNTTEGTTDAADCIAKIASNTSDTLTLVASLGSACSGDSTFSNTETYVITNGYPCLGMVGRGSDVTGQGNYPLEAVYEWGNTHNGSDIDLGLQATGGFIETHIQENRDYYNNTLKPDYTPYTYPHPLRGSGYIKPLRLGSTPTKFNGNRWKFE